MIIDNVEYTGVSMKVFLVIQMIEGSKELITEEFLGDSIANDILTANLTPEENEQVFDLTSIPQDQRIKIMERVEFLINEGRCFDIFYMNFLWERELIKTVCDEDTASDICYKSNRTLTPESLKMGVGHMFYDKREKNESDT